MEGKHIEIEVSGNEKVSWVDSEVVNISKIKNTKNNSKSGE
jgi:hypothetical protein